MSTYEDSPSPLPGNAIQQGRTAFHQNLIGKKVEEIYQITGEILRWPIPRPRLKRQLDQMLGTLAWSGEQLRDSVEQDEKSHAIDRMAQHMVAEASRITVEAAGVLPELATASGSLDYNSAAETSFAVIDDSRLTGGNSTDLIA